MTVFADNGAKGDSVISPEPFKVRNDTPNEFFYKCDYQ